MDKPLRKMLTELHYIYIQSDQMVQDRHTGNCFMCLEYVEIIRPVFICSTI